MLTLKKFFIGVVALSVLLAAIVGLTPSSAQVRKPVEDVNVVNTPVVQALQRVRGRSAHSSRRVLRSVSAGTPTVSINGTPTVNVASLPASGLDVRPAITSQTLSFQSR